ncbi:hypothetical protein V8C37DRAFT_379652 [Trichoderma ceciliae]
MRSTIIATAFIASALADYGVSPEKCAAECTAAHDVCATKPGANMAQCASEYAACLGYNPYEHGFVAPTACSKTTSAAAPTKTAPPHDDCAKECYEEYNKCRSAPGANQSTCASKYAECLGYNPFDGHHDHEEVPTKCSSKPITTPTRPPPPKVDCRQVKECTKELDKCRGKPGANQAECSAEFAKCLGFNPFSPEGERCLKDCEEGHKPHHNQTGPPPPPIHPTHPPVVVSGGSGMKPLDIFSFLAAAIAALL